ncbi:hypothetical protein LV457_17695 [Mycobacterium sp. MYCO198283]|uniref:hypothetical protein n=1 Tax=Mycobacterium sp. MYCO198283 TaxID=2883505 RepID=UPI001E62E12D|nr:hypothetical protein [Mycobacterium sp. MYCO198283]MCG5434109.1 hypothetical protein [Mycobacterium sp. MYCO198283]
MSVAERLRRYDDGMWAATASRGLLRRARKDLTRQPPTLLQAGAEAITVAVGEHTVRFDPGLVAEAGPAAAQCDCPSTVVCRHVIAAGLWLAESAAAEPDSADLHAQLMDIGADALTRHAGRPGHTWALRFVSGLDDADVEIVRAGSIRIGFPRLHVTFGYAGGGLAGLVADQPLTPLPRYQVAAALAYQRRHGRSPQPPAPTKAAAATAETLSDNRARLRASAGRLLADTVRLGTAHPSPALHERYETAAVWAHGAEYYRLSAQLSRLADHIEQQLHRSATTSTDQLTFDVALAYALVHALQRAATTGEEPVRLIGHARNTYSPVQSMQLFGMGSMPWRSATGFHGLTTVFWWPQQRRFLSLTDARPVDVFGFDPLQRHDEPGPWQGLLSPGNAAGRRVDLRDARLNPAGRLSAVEHTRAELASVSGAALVAELDVTTRWRDVRGGTGRARGLLDAPDPLADWLVLAPHAVGAPRFDQTRQELRWPISDADGDELLLTIGYSDLTAAAIDRVESLAGRVPPGTLVTARLASAGVPPRAEPLSLLDPRAAADAVDELYFATAEITRTTPAVAATTPAATPPDPVPAVLRGHRAWLVRNAERGTSGDRGDRLLAELAEQHRLLRAHGFVVFPPEVGGDPAAALLRSFCLLEQTERALRHRLASFPPPDTRVAGGHPTKGPPMTSPSPDEATALEAGADEDARDAESADVPPEDIAHSTQGPA